MKQYTTGVIPNAIAHYSLPVSRKNTPACKHAVFTENTTENSHTVLLKYTYFSLTGSTGE